MQAQQSIQFSNRNRAVFKEQLSNTQFDLLVIGGGITGCGIALDAALRGLKVALLEKSDFASGTSSRSTKLIHGGLRYLKQMEFKLVRDVGSERAVVHRNARHLVIPEKMLLPIIHGGSLGELSTSAGLLVYDLLAGVKRSEHRKMLTQRQTAEAEPLLAKEKLLGGGMYFEYRTDDARLVIELAKSAHANGAVLLNYAHVDSFTNHSNGKVSGVVVTDELDKSTFQVKASVIVNAAGPWVDLLRKEDNSLKGKRLQLTKGVHLVFEHSKFPIQQAAYFDVPDGRMIFAIPRNGITYVGTTDTVYNQNIDEPRCTADDVQYVINAINNMFPTVQLKASDVQSTWAGLRPLIHEDGKSPSELSRKDEILESESGLISIAGGKLTGYRLMSKKIVDITQKRLQKTVTACKTANYRLCGGEFADAADFHQVLQQIEADAKPLGLLFETVREWFYRYGTNTRQLLHIYRQHYAKQSNYEHAVLLTELHYCLENEMVVQPNDYLIRRSGKMFFDIGSVVRNDEVCADAIKDFYAANDEAAKNMLRQIREEVQRVTHFA